jgi:cytidyltransferase-like protein
MSEVIHNVNDLRLQADIRNERLVVTSGGFDPMHVGHLRCLIESAEFARKVGGKTRLVVIVNGDGFLLRKKGYAFMPLEERMEIIAGVRGVDYVVPWDDGGQTVVGAIETLKPFAFTKGGDRDAAANVPEFDVCERLGTKVIFGVGGGKIQSSSELVAAIKDAKTR